MAPDETGVRILAGNDSDTAPPAVGAASVEVAVYGGAGPFDKLTVHGRARPSMDSRQALAGPVAMRFLGFASE